MNTTQSFIKRCKDLKAKEKNFNLKVTLGISLISNVFGLYCLLKPPAIQFVKEVSAVIFPEVKASIPDKVKWALNTYGVTFLKYEVNGGNLADMELIIEVLARRLWLELDKHPNFTSQQLMEAVAKRWNPNSEPDLEAIKRKASNLQPLNLTVMKQAINSAKTCNYATKTGKEAWDKKINHFAHLNGKYPRYYQNIPDSKKSIINDPELRYKQVAIASTDNRIV